MSSKPDGMSGIAFERTMYVSAPALNSAESGTPKIMHRVGVTVYENDGALESVKLE